MSLVTPEKLKKLQEALYVKAKQNAQCRFHQLYDKTYREDILAHAYALSRRNGGAPGVDGMRFEDVEEHGLEKWLRELGEELKQETYRAQAVRRVMIPKASGIGERPLGIPTVKDRVVQTAVKLLLEPIFEAGFDKAAYGYRPGRNAVEAVQQVHNAIQYGHTEVVDADVSKYFDTIPHAELMKCVARRISDGKMLRLIKMWLKCPVEEVDGRGNRRMSGGKKAKRGTPQGGVISPLLANIYMHRFIKAFRQHKLAERFGAVLVNYADDFVVLCRHGAAEVLEIVRRWMARIGLQLNEEKTRVREAREGFDFLGYTFGPAYSRKNGMRYLGAYPSKKAQRRLKERVHRWLQGGRPAPWEKVVHPLNRMLVGWCNYFSYGTVLNIRETLDRYVEERVRSLLRRRHKVQSHGYRQFSKQQIFGELGVRRMAKLPRRGFVHALT